MKKLSVLAVVTALSVASCGQETTNDNTNTSVR